MNDLAFDVEIQERIDLLYPDKKHEPCRPNGKFDVSTSDRIGVSLLRKMGVRQIRDDEESDKRIAFAFRGGRAIHCQSLVHVEILKQLGF